MIIHSNGLGDDLEIALWYNSDRTGEYEKAEEGIYKAFIHTEDQYDIRCGGVEFKILSPGMARVPEPHPDYSGTPKLLIGTATVIKLVTHTLGGHVGFSNDMEEGDLLKLRKLTQEAYMRSNPPGIRMLTNDELDQIIDEVGPETAVKNLDAGTDTRILS